MNWLTNTLIRTAARFGLAERLCRRQDDDGLTPLHLAIMLNAAPDVVQMLVDTCPSSVAVRDDAGRTVLHLVRGVCKGSGGHAEGEGGSCFGGRGSG